MTGKNDRRAALRLWMTAGVVAAVAGALAAPTASGGGPVLTSAAEGAVYGGTSHGEALWLRLGPGRTSIDAFELDWIIPASGCSNHKRYRSFSAIGYYWGRRTSVVNGTFSKHGVDRFRSRGVSYAEDFNVTGAITAEQVTGEFKVKVTAKKGKRTRFTCKSGAAPYRLVN